MIEFLPAPTRLRSDLVVLDTDVEEEYLPTPVNLSMNGPGTSRDPGSRRSSRTPQTRR